MPYVSNRTVFPRKSKHDVGDRRSNEWTHFYGDRRWKKLRAWHIKNHPICAICAMKGISTPAEHVHHRVPFSWFTETDDRFKALLDDENLISVCSECHHQIHKHLSKPDDFETSRYYHKIHDSELNR